MQKMLRANSIGDLVELVNGYLEGGWHVKVVGAESLEQVASPLANNKTPAGTTFLHFWWAVIEV